MVVFHCDVCATRVATVPGIDDENYDWCRDSLGCTPDTAVELHGAGFVVCLTCCCDWCSDCFESHPRCDCVVQAERVIRRVHECLFLRNA